MTNEIVEPEIKTTYEYVLHLEDRLQSTCESAQIELQKSQIRQRKLLMNWYSKIMITVKWKDSYSSFCSLKSGVRQGGVLSPILFNIYMNSLIQSLSVSDLGCHINGVYIGCLTYADDIILLSASVVHLQRMLDTCYSCGVELDLSLIHISEPTRPY